MALYSALAPQTLFDFEKTSKLDGWAVVDDVVMGGRSSGQLGISSDGHGIFEGYVSLENNGGFSSVRYDSGRIPTSEYSKIYIRLKGDGKAYQFRIKARARDYHAYIMPFATTGEWQEIEIPMDSMYPTFRGRLLDMENFNHHHLEEIRFLIANKKNESFKLLIDKIELR